MYLFYIIIGMGFFSKNKNYYKFLRKAGYEIGEHTYVGKWTKLGDKEKIKIGDYTCIANNVVLNPSNHPTNWLSVHPFQYRKVLDKKLYGKFPINENYIEYNDCPKSIEIGNDVWIGEHTFIMGGVKIGDGAVIGMNAVVTKDVPPYAIVAGVPAKVVKYRFSEEIIKDLMRLKWWELPYDFILTLPFDNINECIKKIKAYRKTF